MNRTTYEYDGHDRLVKTRFPITTLGADSSSTTDFEQLTLDPNGNVTARRLRDANTIDYAYDALNRLTQEDLPGSEPTADYTYDLLNRMLTATQNSIVTTLTWDALGRMLTEATTGLGTVTSEYDLAGRRTKVILPGSTTLYADYLYDVLGNVTFIRENGATSGVGVLATYQYDSLSRRSSVTFGNGVVQGFTYDAVSRLATQTNDLASTANDLTQTFAYNPASQISSVTRSNDLYAWTGHYNVNASSTANGLNQIGNVGPKTVTHDTKGNITGVGTDSYGYSSENFLTSGPGSATLGYDPMGRLYQAAQGASTTRMGYDRLDRIAEYDGANAVQRRYVHGPGVDNPIAWYEGSDLSNRRFLSSNERGSVIAVTDSAGTVLGLNKYDEYGVPQSTNLGKFGYTGQAWIPEIKVWYYKARTYLPDPGRFMQTDPIGFAAGPNLYAYVLNDPVNWIDPLGLCVVDICVTAKRKRPTFPDPISPPDLFTTLPHFEDIGGIDDLFREAEQQCETPPVSSTERDAALAGNRGKFWSSRTARGDPFGPIGLTTFTNSSALGQMANFRLRQAIITRSPRMGPEAISFEVQQIGVQIMQTYAGAVSQFGNVSAQQFADIHYTIFGAHNLPATTFGGAPFFGSDLETDLSSPAWELCDE